MVGFASESDEAEESEGAGGLESDEDEEGKERLLNAKEGMKMTHMKEERELLVKMETRRERRKRADRLLKVMRTVISSY